MYVDKHVTPEAHSHSRGKPVFYYTWDAASLFWITGAAVETAQWRALLHCELFMLFNFFLGTTSSTKFFMILTMQSIQ